MLGRKKSKTDYLKELTDFSDKVGDEKEVNEYLAVRSRNKHFKDLIKRNMVVFRSECKKRCLDYNKKNGVKGSWRNVLITQLGVSNWEEVRDTWITNIITDTCCDDVLEFCDDEFVKIHYGVLGTSRQKDKIYDFDGRLDKLTWSSGSNYRQKRTLTVIEDMERKERFDRTSSFLFEDSVVEINYDLVSDDGGNNMGVKFLDEIGVSRLKKRVSKKDIVEKHKTKVNDLTSYRTAFVTYINQIIGHLNGVGEGYGKNVTKAVTKNKNSGNYEISLVRNNIPLMFGNSRYLEVSGDKGDVIDKLGLISSGIEDGKLDSVLKTHKKRCSGSKKPVNK